MSLIWGWGPFSIKPQGEELLLADRVRESFRRHAASFDSSVDDHISACREMQSVVSGLWRSVAKRVQPKEKEKLEIPRGGDDTEVWGPPKMTLVEIKEVPLVRNLIEASLVASLVGIEYEMTRASIESAKFPTDIAGPAFWEVYGQATETATHRSMPGVGFSNSFDPTNRNAVEAAFLVAATRAYVEAVGAVAPFKPNDSAESADA